MHEEWSTNLETDDDDDVDDDDDDDDDDNDNDNDSDNNNDDDMTTIVMLACTNVILLLPNFLGSWPYKT